MQTLAEVIKEVVRLQKDAASAGERLWFRGQRSSRWPIRSSLVRYVAKRLRGAIPEPASEWRQCVRELETSLYFKYRSRAWPRLSEAERTPWGVVFSMQHHGLPTRLVDWTESFLCALYFAQEERERDDAALIFVLRPERLNERYLKVNGLVALAEDMGKEPTRRYHPANQEVVEGALPPIAVVPPHCNERMIAQRSVFMLTGESRWPVELDCGDEILQSFELPPSTWDEVTDYLRLFGAGRYAYYADLPALAAELMAEHDYDIEQLGLLIGGQDQAPVASGGPDGALQ